MRDLRETEFLDGADEPAVVRGFPHQNRFGIRR